MISLAQEPLRLHEGPSGVLSFGTHGSVQRLEHDSLRSFAQGTGAQIRFMLSKRMTIEPFFSFEHGSYSDSVAEKHVPIGVNLLIYPVRALHRIQPILQAGAGAYYDRMNEKLDKKNYSDRVVPVLSAGAGLQVNFTPRFSLWLRGEYMMKYGNGISPVPVIISEGPMVHDGIRFVNATEATWERGQRVSAGINYQIKDLW